LRPRRTIQERELAENREELITKRRRLDGSRAVGQGLADGAGAGNLLQAWQPGEDVHRGVHPRAGRRVHFRVVEWPQARAYQGYMWLGKGAEFNTLMITDDVFYMLYQRRAVPYEYKSSGGGVVYTTVNAIQVFELDLIFWDAGGTEIGHEQREGAKKRLKEQPVDLGRYSTVDGKE
jgi:hypothetical protein